MDDNAYMLGIVLGLILAIALFIWFFGKMNAILATLCRIEDVMNAERKVLLRIERLLAGQLRHEWLQTHPEDQEDIPKRKSEA